MTRPTRIIPWKATLEGDPEARVTREWLVTNGLGGYASGTVSGVATRRYHGALISALPAPLGRVVMLNHLLERVRTATGDAFCLGDEQQLSGVPGSDKAGTLSEFRLELGLPVWRFEVPGGCVIEKRLVMTHGSNTTHVQYRLVEGKGSLRLYVRPALHFRPHEAAVSPADYEGYVFTALDAKRFEVTAGSGRPALRFVAGARRVVFVLARRVMTEVLYPTEESRGYSARGSLWSPGYFRADLESSADLLVTASTEGWDRLQALAGTDAFAAEHERRERLLETAPAAAHDGPAAELVLAADQFIVTPAGRVEETERAKAEGDDVRTVIAGYHWFTDWGRDTMISLEGLTIATGRLREGGHILRAFGHHVRDGLIPNMFPEGDNEGLYHTADASLWFFHALGRYVAASGDRSTLRRLLPTLVQIIEHHVGGTRFGIGVDPVDGLLHQGAEGYQLTWMDAKVDGWVVTPRRGKAVEINALWYDAIRRLQTWTTEEAVPCAIDLRALGDRVRESFNHRFWFEREGYLYDVIDGESGEADAVCRPNQVFAIALDHPVLDESKWESVLRVVRDRLLTPVGLRSLAPGHPDYKPRYYGDLRSRDAAYHQGTVWAWLIGPYIDAWMKVHPGDRTGARRMLDGLVAHLDEACVGSVSEVFDAEPPFAPRGCIAQAWSVAEVLRSWLKTGAGKAARATLETGIGQV